MKRHEKPAMLTALLLCAMSAMGCAAAEGDDTEADTVEAASTSHFKIAQFTSRHSGKCLDVRGSLLVDSAAVIQYTCNEQGNQLFAVSHARDAHSHAREKNYFEIKALHSGKCLDVRGESLQDNAALVQFDCNGQYNQQFSFEPTSDGFYAIKARHSGKCLEVRGERIEDSARLVQRSCNNEYNQQFAIDLSR